MADLAIIVPSRGRPKQLRELVEAVCATAATDWAMYVGLDDDDPTDYLPEFLGKEWDLRVYRGERKSLSAWTNHLAEQALSSPVPPRFLASLGDDHRPRTYGWDRRLIGAIESLGGPPGWAYGDDQFQGPNLPTAWVQSAELVDALGWMMLPACRHLRVDNAVLELGRATGRILYCPDVVIEHMHPVAFKGKWDESYLESNSDAQQEQDRAAFDGWMRDGGLAADAAKLTAAPRRAPVASRSVRAPSRGAVGARTDRRLA